MTIIYCIPNNLVDSIWDKAEPHLANGLLGSDAEYDINDVKLFLKERGWKLFAAIDDDGYVHGAAAVSFITFPNACVAHIGTIGGKMIINQNLVNQFKDLLKSYGADRIQGQVNDAIERLYKRFGFQHKSIVVEMRI
jgi:hypothetical protein